MGKVSEAQARAARKWNAGHREIMSKSSAKSSAKRFILKLADEDDLRLVQQWLNARGGKEMNNGTVKMLLRSYLDRFLEEEAKVSRKVVDVKGGKIRIFDTPKTLHCSLKLNDLGLTEQEALELIKHEKMELALAGSSHPITENWKPKKRLTIKRFRVNIEASPRKWG